MKQVTLFLALSGIILFSCSKENSYKATTGTLQGSWKMIMVADNASGITSIKPAGLQADVAITFHAINAASGTLYGHTPTNHISESSYETGVNGQLHIPALAMTKLAETSWGQEFVINIRSSETYKLTSNGNLVIITAEKTLTFQPQ